MILQSCFGVGILIGTLTMELGGVVTINCEKTGYKAEIEFKLKVRLFFFVCGIVGFKVLMAITFNVWHLSLSYKKKQAIVQTPLLLYFNAGNDFFFIPALLEKEWRIQLRFWQD